MNSSTNPLLVSALAFAARGWRVHPLHGMRDGRCNCGRPDCGAPGKRPRLSEWPEKATTDPATIRAWWTRWPDGNVGLLTGMASGLIVLDVDPRNGGDESLRGLVALHGDLPSTPLVITGGGGHHYYFAHPGAPTESWQPAAGLDLQADGGHCVAAPPSLHLSGGRYAWAEGLDPGVVELAPLPSWLIRPARDSELVRSEATVCAPRMTARSDSATRWSESALQRECERVARAGVGTRNNQLNRAAFALGQLVPHLLSEARVTEALLDSARACGLSEDSAEEEVRGTIASGLGKGLLSPRYPPQRAASRPPSRPAADRGTAVTPAAPGPEGHHNTDLGNSERFAAQHSGGLRYCAAWRQWMVWDGRRWTSDRDGEVNRRASLTVRAMYAEAAGIEDGRERERLVAHASRSEGAKQLQSLLQLAQADLRIAVLPEAFDPEQALYRFNVLNGTIDLKTGRCEPHDPGLFITKLAPVTFDPAATAPIWNQFLAQVLPDPEVRAFVRRFVGYSLAGDTSEQVLLLLFGTGANGKSTFLETLGALFGDFAQKADFETFLRAKGDRDRKGGARPDLLALAGRRLVLAAEADEGRQLDANMIKEVTGGDTLTARGLYDRFQTSFRPQCKLILASNHRPEVREATEAMWRRLLEVPFTVTIPEDQRDAALLAKLRAPGEQSGILNWALDGARDFLSTDRAPRLRPPDAVRRATGSYREDQDAIAPFLTACCVRDLTGRSNHKEVRDAYLAWCSETEEEPLSEKALSQALQEHGFERVRGKDKHRTRGWKGLRIPDVFDQAASDGSDGL